MSDSFWGMERRKSARALLKTDLFYSVEHPPELKLKFSDNVETATLVDLGEGGLGFVSDIALPQDTELDITFNLYSKERGNLDIRASGIVRYCFSQGDSSAFRVGLEFTNIDQNSKDLIVEFVKNFSAF